MPTNNKTKAKWTIMIYMAADDDTSLNAAIEFLGELEELSPALVDKKNAGKVNILLQAYMDWETEKGAQPNFEARRFRIQPQFMLHPERFKSKTILMGNPSELSRFIKWCKTNYKAEKYMLLLWGHGTGSGLFSNELQNAHARLLKDAPDFTITDLSTGRQVKIGDILTPGSPYFNNLGNEARFRITYTENNLPVTDIVTAHKEWSPIFRNEPKYILEFSNPALQEKLRPYSESKSNLDALIGRELNKSLERSFGRRGKLDLLVILGCCMQMVEFGYEIRKQCRFYVSSEELMFFEGYNYQDTIADLIDKPGTSPRDLGKQFVKQTPEKKDYNEALRDLMAISCVDLGKIDKIERGLNDIAKHLFDNFEKLNDVIRDTRRQCSHFGENSFRSSFIDVVWFLNRLNVNLAKKRLNKGLRRKIKSIQGKLERDYIIEEYIGDRKKPKPKQQRSMGGHGVAIYFPSSERDHLDDESRGKFFNRKEKAFVNTFSENNHWNKMIFKYMEKFPGERRVTLLEFPDYFRIMNLLDERARLLEAAEEYL